MGEPVEEKEYPMGIPVEREDDGVVLPEPGLRDTASKELSHSVEAHTVVSALVLVLAVGCDCITALDTPMHMAEAAASLRISSIVTLLAMASPSIVKDRVVDQRVLLGVLLAFLALMGEHYGSSHTRIGDTIYTLFVLLVGVQIYTAGGIEAGSVRPDSVLNSPHRRQTMSGLCGSLFFYVGLRGLRSAFYAPQEAVEYSVYYTINDALMVSPGYSFMSGSITVPLAFGHGVLACVGIVISLHGEAHLTGSSAVAFEVGAAGVAAAIAAFWSTVGYSEQLDTLRTLYGSMACSGKIDVCKEAYRARRFAISNGSSAGLWIASLAACIFSFAIERRNMEDIVTRAETLWKKKGVGAGTILLISSCAAILAYISTEGEQWHTDICALVALLGVFVGFTSDTLLGAVLYVGAQAYEEIRLLIRFGASRVFNHLTHCTLFLTIVLMAIHLVVSILKSVLRRYWNVANESPINTTLAFLATFGTSLAAGLYIASAGLIACSDGTLPEDLETIRDGSGARTMIAFAANHFLPFFAWVPLYACRCEVQLINSYVRAVAWLMAVPLLILIYITVLSFMQTAAPTASIVETESALLLGCVGFFAWIAAAFV